MSLHRQRPPEMGTITTETVSEIDRDKHIFLQMMDLHRQKVAPVDLTSMMCISAPCLEDQLPQNPPELTNAFLSRLWLYHPQARSTSCDVVAGAYGVARPPEMDENSKSAINPLDLVAAVYMTTNSFLQQEITYRMTQCNFAVPLFLPPVYPDKNGTVLLWPFRGVLCKWKSPSLEDSESGKMKNMANSRMPFLSALRLGDCNVSKSRVLNNILGGTHKANECFVNRDTEGGLLPRVLSDGLVEVSWNLTPGDDEDCVFSRPVLIANLRGDAADCDSQVNLLCYASAVLIVFCGQFGMEERKLLQSWRDNASHLILIDCSAPMEEDGEENTHERKKQIIVKDLELPEGCVINAQDGDEDALAGILRDTLNRLVPYLHTTSLVATAGMASDLNMKVDEDVICRMAFSEVEEIINGTEDGVSKFLEEQLPLQGAAWKGLCHIEKVECRLKGDAHGIQHQPVLSQGTSGEKDALTEEIMNYKLTEAMKSFIESLCTFDTTKRAFFVSWMKIKLQVMQLEKLSDAEEEQQEPCIGLEHFLREMGLIYERYFRSPNYDLYNMFRLPYVAAELLLYGVPLELYDGDASVFPLNWVYSVLYEVYRQLPQNSRMSVLTTLGFYHSKNAEMLSSLFGVNFPKWGRRHIKGAYLLFLSLPDNIRAEMNCEYLMLICTEGLTPPPSRQDDSSFVHDCELATFVSGLSDITLVHLPQEGQADTRNKLQVAVNAVLHTNDLERKPTFYVVSEGSAKEGKILSYIIDIVAKDKPLNEAKQELQRNRKESTDHILLGPWTNKGLPAETDQTYSDAALKLKQSLVGIFHEKATSGQPTCLGAFMEHMCNVWELVKNQTFSAPFGDTYIADALIGLCTKLVEGEQQLKDVMDQWVQEMDNRISELEESRNQIYGAHMDDITKTLVEETAMHINLESEKMKASLWEHLRQGDIDVSIMETYKADLFKRVQYIQQQVTLDMNPKIESAMIRHDMSAKMQALLTALEAALEVKLRTLLENCKNSDTLIDNKQLEEEFNAVWNDIPSNLDLGSSKTDEIHASMVEQLKDNFNSRGLKKQKIKLKDTSSLMGFTVKNGHFALSSKMKRTLKHHKEVAQRFTDNLIEDCDKRISEKLKHKEGYSDSYMRELLAVVDKGVEVLKLEPFVMKPKFEVDLKVYICSKASESFQQMQEVLKSERQTREKFLQETKEKHLMEFIYDFWKRDQCQKAARHFINLCLRPTALDFIYSSLERQILDDITANDDEQIYTSSKNFHYHILKELLLEDSFENFHEYLQSNENFCRKQIGKIILERLSGSMMIEDRREQRIQQISRRMTEAIFTVTEDSSGVQSNARLLLERICATLESPGDVTVPKASLEGPLFDISTHREHFMAHLKEAVTELTISLVQEFNENAEVIEVPDDLSHRLQEMLYGQVKGCDQQCPFCKASCDLGGVEHAVHESLVHRPKGLVCYTNADSVSLSHISCSADVAGENHFQNRHTGGHSVLYKNYQVVYPDWHIPAEMPGTDDCGAYWKYVLARFNTSFAQVYQCEPASLPDDWMEITQERALWSLRNTFFIED